MAYIYDISSRLIMIMFLSFICICGVYYCRCESILSEVTDQYGILAEQMQDSQKVLRTDLKLQGIVTETNSKLLKVRTNNTYLYCIVCWLTVYLIQNHTFTQTFFKEQNKYKYLQTIRFGPVSKTEIVHD